MSTSKGRLVYFLVPILAALGIFETGPAQTENADGSFVNRITVLVTNKSNQPVMDLTQSDFIVLDDGKQQITSFFQKEDIPISYGLIVDNTGSMRPSAEEARLVAKMIVSNNKPQDKTFVMRLVDGRAERIADWTSDKTMLLSALNAVTRGSGAVSLIDSIHGCSEYIGKDQASKDIAKQRRVIILVTDGLDRDSPMTMAQLLGQLHKDNVQLFALGIRPLRQGAVAPQRFPVEQSIAFLNALTKETGGRSLFPKSESELRESAELISSYMKSQYVIGYSVAESVGDGSLREIAVYLTKAPGREKYLVSARHRYAVSGR